MFTKLLREPETPLCADNHSPPAWALDRHPKGPTRPNR